MSESSGSDCGNAPPTEPQLLTRKTINLTSNLDSDSLCSELSEREGCLLLNDSDMRKTAVWNDLRNKNGKKLPVRDIRYRPRQTEE